MANDFDSDAMLAFVGQLTKQFQDLQKVLGDIGNQSGVGMKKAGDEVERFGSTVRKHAGTSVKEMTSGLKEMATSLLGPVGLAVGIYKVGEALETFAVGQMRLQNFARDAGYTSKSIQQMQQAGEHMGYTIAETNEIIKNFGSAVNELHLDRQASQLWRDLGRIRDGGYEVAQTIQRMKQEGKDNAEIQAYAADLIVKQLRRQTDEGNRAAQALSNAFKIPISMAEQLAGAKAKVKDEDILVLTPEQRKKQEEYNDAWLKMKREFWKDLGVVEQGIIDTLVDAKRKNEEAGGAFNRMRQEDIKTFNEWKEWLLGKGKVEKQSFTPGEDDGALPAGARPISFSRDELVQTEKDSRGLLEDIRDTLMRFELEAEEDGKGGGGGGSMFRPGGRGGGGGGDGGGTPTGGPGTRADRNNNPGNIKFGPFAKAQGATSQDERGFAVFPDRETGFKAAEALLGTEAYSGMTLAQIGRRWAAGDPGWARNVSAATGIPIDAVPTPEQRTQIARVGIPRAEGSHLGAGTPGAFGGDVHERQAAVAATRRGALDPRLKGALDYASAKTGLTVDVTSGGQRMPGVPGAVGSHRHDRGQAADFNLRDENGNIVRADDPRAVAFYEHAARAGATGGGARYMRDPEKIHLDIHGGVYAGPRAFREAMKRGTQDPLTPDEIARAKINKSLVAGTGGDLGGARISVDFTGVPKDVKTDAELMDTGIFKTLKLSRTAGQAAMAGSTAAPQNNWVGGE